MAQKLKIKAPAPAEPATKGKPLRISPAARRNPLSIAQSLRVGSRPNLAQLPSRAKR